MHALDPEFSGHFVSEAGPFRRSSRVGHDQGDGLMLFLVPTSYTTYKQLISNFEFLNWSLGSGNVGDIVTSTWLAVFQRSTVAFPVPVALLVRSTRAKGFDRGEGVGILLLYVSETSNVVRGR